jgi:hypothetical protein
MSSVTFELEKSIKWNSYYNKNTNTTVCNNNLLRCSLSLSSSIKKLLHVGVTLDGSSTKLGVVVVAELPVLPIIIMTE